MCQKLYYSLQNRILISVLSSSKKDQKHKIATMGRRTIKGRKLPLRQQPHRCNTNAHPDESDAVQTGESANADETDEPADAETDVPNETTTPKPDDESGRVVAVETVGLDAVETDEPAKTVETDEPALSKPVEPVSSNPDATSTHAETVTSTTSGNNKRSV